ncbi:hypothetical protein [Streptosporangium sp. NPDC023615]|uniref:hypothetical protein n=1 Tax=Streptosporangium sp. NPDC023615 TaxID=3154794 RepID=UPI00342236A4
MTQPLQEATRADIAAIDIGDICTPEYTVKLERIRYEAALVLSRIAMRHLFATGEAVHDPEAPPPSTGPERQPHFFRKRLIEYLADRGDLVRDGYVYRPAPSWYGARRPPGTSASPGCRRRTRPPWSRCAPSSRWPSSSPARCP